MIFFSKRLIPLLAVLFTGVLVLLSLTRDVPSEKASAQTSEGTKGFLETPVPPEETIVLPEEIPFPELDAHAYLVRLAGSNQALAKRREFKPVPPASLIKLLTATIAEETLPKTLWITFSENIRNVEEKRSGVSAGESLLRDDVVRLLLIESANDSARALAEAVAKGPSFEERLLLFVSLMNQKAGDIGMKNTIISNPTGLDPAPSEGGGTSPEPQYSTAEDLALLAEYIWYQHPKLWEITRTIETVVYSDTAKEYRIKNTNELLKEFPGILGGKTGFTDEAQGTLILLYPFGSNKVAIVVLLGSEDRFGDGRKVIKWLEEVNGNR